MADQLERSKLYEYKANHALVLQSHRDRRGPREPTGEAVSLRERLGGSKMGDRARGRSNEEVANRIVKDRKRRADRKLAQAPKRQREDASAGLGDILQTSNRLQAAGGYTPSNPVSQRSFGKLVAMMRSKLGDQPHSVLHGAAVEMLTALQSPSIRPAARRSEAEELVGPVSEAVFRQFQDLSRSINDYVPPGSGPGADAGGLANDGDGELGVAVVLDDDNDDGSDDGENMAFEVVDSDDDQDDDLGQETATGEHVRANAGAGEGDDDDAGNGAAAGGGAAKGGLIDPSSIDGFWLQRQLAKYYDDANTTQRYAADITRILGEAPDVRSAESQLVVLLDYDKFDLVKLLVTNRGAVHYCTRLGQAQSDAEREAIEAEMAADAARGGPALLAALRKEVSAADWRAQRERDAKQRVSKEASALRKMGGAAAGSLGQDAMEDEEAAEEAVLGASAAAAGAGAGTASAGAGGTGRTLNLDQLAFSDGARTMTNEECVLPDKAWRKQGKGFEEVHVPALQPKPLEEGERLVPIAELPAWSQKAFAGMQRLNRVQSRLYQAAFNSPENLLLCAPTGAGKTNVAVLTVLNAIKQYRDPATGEIDRDRFKIVYIAPMKALVQEVVANFTRRIGEPYDLEVAELSGDRSMSRREIMDTNIIVTTPEKWDIVTRKAGDRSYTQLVRLIIIDEVHLLHDDRGPVLEAIVARTLRQVEATRDQVRIVGLSATLPNYEDVAAFLRVDRETGLFHFDGSFRPCPLQQVFIGVTEKRAIKRLQLMNKICYDKVVTQAAAGQILIFVHSRKETANTARALKDMALENDAMAHFLAEDSESRVILEQEAGNAKSHDLKELLPFGFAIHHAGMDRADRTLVEDLFADGHAKVLVSTSTLAWGVNLPAHTVIIKGTQIYDPSRGSWVEMTPQDVMQMLGRAGRPQYDQFGEGIILTAHEELQYYLSLVNTQLPIESQMIAQLADHLNAEVVGGAVTSITEAANWLTYTYLYVRMLRQPLLYGIPAAEADEDDLLLGRRRDLAHSAASLLDRHGLVRYDRRSGALQTTALGRVSAYYYIKHPSIATFNQHLKPTMQDIDIIRLFSLSYEFKNIVVRQEEREEVAQLRERVPVPVKDGPDEPAAKVAVLLQAYISRMPLDGLALNSDMVYVHQSAARIFRAMFEICLRRGWTDLVTRTLALCQMVEHRMWASQTPLRQFDPGLPDDMCRSLERKDIAWDRYPDLSAADLGELVRMPRAGKTLHRLVHTFPRVALAAQVQPVTRGILRVDLTITPDFLWDDRHHGGSQLFWVLVEDADQEHVLHHEVLTVLKRRVGHEHHMSFTVRLMDPLPPQYFVRVVADRWLKSETVLPLSFQHLILPARFPPPTELLDLQPMKLSALKWPEAERAWAPDLHGASGLNPVQTQTFRSLYESDDNTFIAAPAGSGKLQCAELALLRLFKQDPEATAVYVTPHKAAADAVFERWEPRFDQLGLGVAELTGELQPDLRLLSRAHVVVTTPAIWERLTRGWATRAPVRSVRLVVVDDLHLIASESVDEVGPTYEVAVSRTRLMAAQLALQAEEEGAEGSAAQPLRIVGLSASAANGRDLGDWIGAPAARQFCFHPQTRPLPLEVRVQGFDEKDVKSRLQAMARPAYNALAERCRSQGRWNDAAAGASGAEADLMPGKPGIVYVPSRLQAQITAIDLMAYAEAEGTPDRFCRAPSEAAQLAAIEGAGISDPRLRRTAMAGVVFAHEGMLPADRAAALQLFSSGVCGVLVAPAVETWSLATRYPVYTVVIMGTQRYDGREHRFVHYPLSDLLKMMGQACRPGLDDSGVCALLCAAPRRDHLKQFLFEPLPVESHVDTLLHDAFNAEVASGTIQSQQEAVDYLTWTFLYRRLPKNPNFYNLQGTSKRHLSDYLSELVESTIQALAESRCVEVEAEVEVSSLNLGLVASYYGVRYSTMDVIAGSMTPKTKVMGTLRILAEASEFEDLPIRSGEAQRLRALAPHLPVALRDGAEFDDPHTKANILLQAHMARLDDRVGGDMRGDQQEVLRRSLRLLQAMVDVAASHHWLRPAVAAMQLSQLLVQGLWTKDSELLQIPHFSPELAQRCIDYHPPAGGGGGEEDEDDEEEGADTVLGLIEMEDEPRKELLGMPAAQLVDVAAFCNRFPAVEVDEERLRLRGGNERGELEPGKLVSLSVPLQREESTAGMDEGAGVGGVHAPRFPDAKAEGWWLMLSDPASKRLLAVKRIAIAKSKKVKLEFDAPEEPGSHDLELSLVCDSYVGADTELSVPIVVGSSDAMEDDDDDDV